MSLPRYPKYKQTGVEWLGAIPAHWECVRVGTLFREVNDPGAADLPILSVSIHDGVSDEELDESESDRKVTRSDDRSKYKAVAPGDLTYNMMRAWQGGFGTVRVHGMVSPAYVVARPKGTFATSIIEMMLRTPNAVSEMKRHSRGVTDFRLRLYWEDFKVIKVALPPADEQRDILAFLDRETAKIDALIAEQEKLIALLAEKRQATISHAVTRGLNPNAPMKDSGVAWLGEIPAHWQVKRFRDVCASISTGPFGTTLGSDDYIIGGVPVINPSHLVDNRIVPDEETSVSVESASRLTFWALHAGDLVIARRGELGRAAIVNAESDGWICGTGSLRATPKKYQTTAEFLHAILQSTYAREWLNRASVGSTMANLNEGILGSLPIALPVDTDEQTKLTMTLSRQILEIGATAALAQESVALLHERRSALIAAAVTGQIDVRREVSTEAVAA